MKRKTLITSIYCNGDRYRCSPNTSPFSKWCNYSLSHIWQVCSTKNDIVIQSFENSNENVCACALASLIHQSIDQCIPHLCCEYQLICTFNKWSISISILANQIQAHVHARAGRHFSVHQSIDQFIPYLCCKYKLICTFIKWSIGISRLANQIQAHVHARAGRHFSVCQSIDVHII